MVRDPIDRIAAHWVHNFAKRREKGDLRDTLMHPSTSYLARSHYYMQLQQFLRFYPREQILLVEQDELRNRRLETLRTVFEFIGVDPEFSHARFSDERHKTSRKTRATPLAMRLERIGETPAGTRDAGDLLARGRQPVPVPQHDRRPGRPRGAALRGAPLPARGRRAPPRADRARVRELVDLGMSDPSDKPRKPRLREAGGESPTRPRSRSPSTPIPAAPAPCSAPSWRGSRACRASPCCSPTSSTTARSRSSPGCSAPGKLGAYALLFFLTGLVTQVIHILSKPGTMMRTFGVSDDDDDDVEGDERVDDEQAGVRPDLHARRRGRLDASCWLRRRSPLTFIFSTQIAEFLLNDPGQADAVVFATITGSRLGDLQARRDGDLVRGPGARPTRSIDAARPTFNLIAIIAILSAGAGVKGAIIGQTIGTTLATLICVALIWKSFQVAFSFGELKEILSRGAIRAPIASSMWVVQNADSFILSRFVDHKDIGLYQLASRTGFMVAFLPQGFRIALRPVRKTATYEAFIRQYGIAVANGQMLAYFWLLTLTAVLAMVLGGEILIQIGGPQFESAAPLIPLTAGAMSMPALYRSVSQYASYPNKRRNFVLATILVAISYIGLMLAAPERHGPRHLRGADLDAGGVPDPDSRDVHALAARPAAARVPLRRDARSPPWLPTAIAVGFHFLHPAGEWPKLPVIAALMLVWFGALFVLRIIPRYHWDPIRHITKLGAQAALGAQVRPQRRPGARSKAQDRRALRTAVVDRLPAAIAGAPEATATRQDGAAPSRGAAAGRRRRGAAGRLAGTSREGPRLVALASRGRQGRRASRSSERSELDGDISLYLFSDEPVAVRLRKMRQLLAAGADAHELRVLEGLRDDPREGPGARPGRASGRRTPAPTKAPARAASAPRPAQPRSDAPDHDPVGLDRDLDLPVAGPVLGVDGVVLDRGVEPETEALLGAVVEGGLDRGAARAPRPPRPRRRLRRRRRRRARRRPVRAVALGRPPPRLRLLGLLLVLLFFVFLLLLFLLLFLLASSVASISASISSRSSSSPVSLLGRQLVAAAELAQLGGRDVELVGDPGVGAPLAHPGTDLVEL